MDRRQFCWSLAGGGAALAYGVVTQAAFQPKIQWNKDLKTAHKLAVQRNKPILIVFSASWCTYCHKLLRETLGERPMVAFVEQNFIPVVLDYDKDTRIAKILEVESLPCTVVLSPQADLLVQSSGFAQAPAFRETLQTALDKHAEILQVRGVGEPR